jgi:alcohol dehydrogenase (cytochrome c)
VRRFALALTMIVGVVTVGAAPRSITYERIRDSSAEPGNWLTYSGNYQGHRFSKLSEINKTNVARLKAAWVYQMSDPDKFETSPIVVDGTLYITERSNIVTALDGKTGQMLWSYRGARARGRGCCGRVNRGLAVLDDVLYLTSFDAHLTAIDRQTGTPRWDRVIADTRQGYSTSAAPLALRDKVIVGAGGGDLGARGFLAAYAPRTGDEVWRFWTVPGPGEPGHETWTGDSWKTGGALTWVTGSFDPDLNILYWGTGNPGPDYNGDDRAGDNLYSSSLLALDPDTGRLRWHFQFTPHDVHDRDAAQVPLLIDRTVNGTARKLVVSPNRNGFYYVLDRLSGEFLTGTPFVKQDWALGLDAGGRPTPRPDATPLPQGTRVYPGPRGATNWMSPSYSPLTNLIYVSAYENYPGLFFKRSMPYTRGQSFEGGMSSDVTGNEPEGAIKALEVDTGRMRWEFKMRQPSYAGLLSTAGGLVFGGAREGDVFALDAETGKPLWHFKAGGEVMANPVTFLADGKQHVAVAAGVTLFVFALD